MFFIFIQFIILCTSTPNVLLNINPDTVLSQATYLLTVERKTIFGALTPLPSDAIVAFHYSLLDYKYNNRSLAGL